MKINQLLPLLLLSFLLSNCDQKKKQNDSVYVSESLPNTIHTTLQPSTKDSTYSFYVPANHKKNKSSVILLFDAHGDGMLPITKYKSLADKYDFILMASNQSKNGNPLATNLGYAKNLMENAIDFFHPDSLRIYACGFSGGSRIASALAIYQGGIHGVIGIGAGFPPLDKPITHQFDFCGIAGTQDFNLTEMQELENMLNKSDINHILLTYKGKHEWCKINEMEKAFQWIRLLEIKNNIIPKDEHFLSGITMHYDSLIQKNKLNKDVISTYLATMEYYQMMKGLIPLDNVKQTLINYKKDQKIKNYWTRLKDIKSAEVKLKQGYLNALSIKEPNWWKEEIILLRNSKKYPSDQLEMNERIISYLSLACYMNCTQLISQNQLDEAKHYALLYEIIDPENPEAKRLNQTLIPKSNHP